MVQPGIRSYRLNRRLITPRPQRPRQPPPALTTTTFGVTASLGETLSQLSRDMASLKNTFALLASQAGGEAAKTMRNMSDAVASQVGDAASGVADTSFDLATPAKQYAKTFASELEAMTRRNPLGTIAECCYPSLGQEVQAPI